MKKEKVAWIFSGGGGHTAYEGGACKAISRLGIPKPNIIFAGSGGACVAFFLLADQVKEMEDIWCNGLSNKKIINLRRFWRIFGRDEMINIFRKVKLNMRKIATSEVNTLIAVTNAISGEKEYFTNRNSARNLWKILTATVTVPFFSGILEKDVVIGRKRYIDSAVSSNGLSHIEKAIELGANKIVYFGEKLDFNKKPLGAFLYRLWLDEKILSLFSEEFKLNQDKFLKKIEKFKIPRDVKVIFVSPKRYIRISPISNNRKALRREFNRGYNETLVNKELKRFYGL